MVEDEADDGIHRHGVTWFSFIELLVPGGEVSHVTGIGALGARGGAGGEQVLVVLLQRSVSFHGRRIPWGRASARGSI